MEALVHDCESGLSLRQQLASDEIEAIEAGQVEAQAEEAAAAAALAARQADAALLQDTEASLEDKLAAFGRLNS